MRRALVGEGSALVGPVPARPQRRSPRASGIPRRQSSPAVTAVSPASVKRSRRPALEVAGSAALLGAMALAVLAFTSDPSSTPATASGNFSVSSPTPTPIGLTEAPESAAPTVPYSPEPVVVLAEADRPAPTRVVEKATPREVRVSGSPFSGGGPGNSIVGNDLSPVTPGNARGNINGPKHSGDKKPGSANANGNNGHGNGNRGNGKPK
jgi:hypothetical protein